MEIWRTVPSSPEIKASSLGRVCVSPCYRKTPTGGTRLYTPKPTFGYEAKSSTARSGSPKRMVLRVRRLNKTFKVHQLVCEAFHGQKPFEDAIVLHLDEDPSNNRPENLKWGTRKENQNAPKVKDAFKSRRGTDSTWEIKRRKELEQ